jgi:hypothetical protein
MFRSIMAISLLAAVAGGHVPSTARNAQADELARPDLTATTPEASSEPAQPGTAAEHIEPVKNDALEIHQQRVVAFEHALGEYLAHRDPADWRERVGIDRRLLRAAGQLPPQYLAGRLDAAPGNMEVATAVAVCLGEGRKQDPPEFVAGLLAELLGTPIERVRYRAAEAIVQRMQDDTMPPGINDQLAAVLAESLIFETNQLNAGSMRYAIQLLKPDTGTSESP